MEDIGIEIFCRKKEIICEFFRIFNDVSATNDDFEEFGIDFGEEDGKLKSGNEQAEMTPPPPPTIPNNTQLDRKEKVGRI